MNTEREFTMSQYANKDDLISDMREEIARLKSALANKPEASEPVKYAEVRKCENCWHVGVDDRADGIACCGGCGWSGDEPKEDKCPACERENHMMAACPNCNEEYHLVEEIKLTSTAALQKRIEELEAREISLSAIERLKSVLSRAGYSTDESLETFAARLETHIYSLCQYAESKLDSIKAGDVQAPKEGKWVPIEPTESMVAAAEGLTYEFGSGEESITGYVSDSMAKEVWMNMIAAAPTDKEGK